MEALFQRLTSGNNVIIVPQVNIEQDGHPILCYRYDIFKAGLQKSDQQAEQKAILSKEEKLKDADYLGQLTFEIPGKVFSYAFEENRELTTQDTREIISVITDIRENPESWVFNGQNDTKL